MARYINGTRTQSRVDNGEKFSPSRCQEAKIDAVLGENVFPGDRCQKPDEKKPLFEVIDRVECDASKIHVVGIGIILIRRWYRKLKFNSRVAGRVGHRTTGLYQLSRERIQVLSIRKNDGTQLQILSYVALLSTRWKLTKNCTNFFEL